MSASFSTLSALLLSTCPFSTPGCCSLYPQPTCIAMVRRSWSWLCGRHRKPRSVLGTGYIPRQTTSECNQVHDCMQVCYLYDARCNSNNFRELALPCTLSRRGAHGSLLML
jgi:hypothetical protein